MRRVPAVVVLVLLVLTAAAPALASDPGRVQQWALDTIGTSSAWTRGRGDGVVVAVVDSGVDLGHVDLRDRLVPGIDLVDDDRDPQDANGHGTHVAGIVAATAGNGTGIEGVAPGARIMPVRVLDATGAGSADDVVAGVEWAVANGADVVNLSLGEDTQAVLGSSVADAVRAAWDAGVVPVVAAGNQLVLSSGFSDEPALVVAATTRADQKPTYSSSTGSAKWGIAAPGGDNPDSGAEGAVLSTYWVEGQRDQYAYQAGTSMAAPHVAGAVAVLLGLGMTPQQAVDRLLATAVDVGAPGPDSTFGAGRLDLAAAAAASDGVDPDNEEPPPPATTATTRPSSTPTSASATTAPAGGSASTTAPGATSTSSPATTAPGSSTSATVDEEANEDAAAGGAGTSDDDDSASRTGPAVLAAALAAGAAIGTGAVSGRLRRTS